MRNGFQSIWVAENHALFIDREKNVVKTKEIRSELQPSGALLESVAPLLFPPQWAQFRVERDDTPLSTNGSLCVFCAKL